MKNVFVGRLRALGWALLLLLAARPAALGQPSTAPHVWTSVWMPDLGRNGTVRSTAVDAAGNLYMAGGFADTATFGPFQLISAGDFDVFVAKRSAAGQWLWAVRAGGPDGAGCYALVLDTAARNVTITGNYYGQGTTFGTTTLAPAGTRCNIFVAQLSATTGAWKWAAQAGGKGYDMGYALARGQGGLIHVCGEFRDDTATFGALTIRSGRAGNYQSAFLASLDSTGTWVMAERIGGFDVRAGGLAVDSAGSLYISGYFVNSVAQFGSCILNNVNVGFAEGFVAKRRPAGGWAWAAQTRGQDDDYIYPVTLDSAGNLYVPGMFSGPTTFGTFTVTGYRDAFVAKLSPAGQWLWVATGGGPSIDAVGRILIGPDHQLLVAGVISPDTASFGATTVVGTGQSYDVFVAQLTRAGQWQWVLPLQGNRIDYIGDLLLLPNHALLLTGNFSSDSLQVGPIRLHNPYPGVPRLQTFAAQLGGAMPVTPTATPEALVGRAPVLVPNPAHTATRLTTQPGAAVTLLDATGRAVLTTTADATGTVTLPVAGLPPGVYVVRAGAVARRLVVE